MTYKAATESDTMKDEDKRMKEDFFQKAHKDATRRWEAMRFVKWIEATYPNLKAEYRRYKGEEE